MTANNNFICIYMFMEAVIPMFGRLINLINLSVKEKDHTLKAFCPPSRPDQAELSRAGGPLSEFEY
jgi:hypothetical protein